MQFSSQVTKAFIDESLKPEYYDHLRKQSTNKNEIVYRFKTLEEFVKDYGDGWRNKIKMGWGESMNVLLGLPFVGKFSQNENNSAYGCSISKDMLVEYTDVQREVINKINSLFTVTYNKDLGISSFIDFATDNSFSINNNPTGNCQLSVLSYFNNIANHVNYSYDIEVNSQIIWNILRVILANTVYIKPLLQIDINHTLYKYVKDWPKTVCAEYESTNSSNMVCIYLTLLN